MFDVDKTDEELHHADIESLERRIMERVAGGAADDSSKIVVDHSVVVSVQDRTLESEVAEVRAGGIFVPGKDQQQQCA